MPRWAFRPCSSSGWSTPTESCSPGPPLPAATWVPTCGGRPSSATSCCPGSGSAAGPPTGTPGSPPTTSTWWSPCWPSLPSTSASSLHSRYWLPSPRRPERWSWSVAGPEAGYRACGAPAPWWCLRCLFTTGWHSSWSPWPDWWPCRSPAGPSVTWPACRPPARRSPARPPSLSSSTVRSTSWAATSCRRWPVSSPSPLPCRPASSTWAS